MEYQINDGALAIEVTLKGRMEFGDHPTFRELTAKLNELPAKKIIVNLAGVDFIDSSGLGMLIVIRNLAERRKSDFLLKKPTETVRRILVTAQFTALARIED